MKTDPHHADTVGVYSMSVATELTGIGPQNIRAYEKQGLLTPARTSGGTRRFSNDDIARLRRIHLLLRAGLNLAGIAMVIQLETENTDLRSRLDSSPDSL